VSGRASNTSLLCTGVKVLMISVSISTVALPDTEFDLFLRIPKTGRDKPSVGLQGRNHIIMWEVNQKVWVSWTITADLSQGRNKLWQMCTIFRIAVNLPQPKHVNFKHISFIKILSSFYRVVWNFPAWNCLELEQELLFVVAKVPGVTVKVESLVKTIFFGEKCVQSSCFLVHLDLKTCLN
jgi:hypothetical protein